ncbi:MAG: FtsX-like permease family protein [Candidatus Rokuibacteriota bacterium]|nr:MAG: FtsX-like permease family protein [Candidatus Rokubacteria bacterium]
MAPHTGRPGGEPGRPGTIAVALRLAWRQARGGRRHLAALFACVALGVGALVAVGTLGAGLEATLAREAKALLGGDVELRAARPLPADADAALARLAGAGARVVHVRELAGMARAPARGATVLVELKAPSPGYPLYGALVTTPAAPLSSLLADDGAVVEHALLVRLGLALGDRLTIGETTLTVRGVVEAEPDRAASLVRLGPRLFLSPAALERARLVSFGSRVRYRALLRLPDGLTAGDTRAELARAIVDPGVRVAAYDEAQPGLRRFFSQLTAYLGLVGLASLLVGGLGVAASVSAFIARQVPTIAALKALGAETRTLVAAYVVQTQAVALAAGLVGAGLGLALQPVLAAALAGLVPFALEARAQPWTIARAVTMGLATTLLCTWAPLAAVRRVPAWLLLRRDVEPSSPARSGVFVIAPVVVGLAVLTLWQAGSLRIGGIFVGASLAALLVLAALARGLTALARRLPRARGLAWRHGLAALQRPGGHAPRVVVALGIAVTLLVAVALLEGVLGRQIDLEQRREAPSFFFVDVQPDQVDAFTALVARTGGSAPQLTAVVRARLAAVDGERLTRDVVERRRTRGEDRRWYFTRDYALTFGDAPPAGNTLTAGRWWTTAEGAGRALASVEETAARELGLRPGSRLTFDVQGVPVDVEVTSVRRVDWQSLTTNFFFVLSPAALAGAPATWVATTRVPATAEPALQNAVVAAFPNVTAIPVRDVLDRVAAVLGDIAVAVRLVASFTLGTGVVVMAGALAATRSQRLYESVVLRALGATRGVVARAFAVEYGLLGAAAGVGGGALATVLAWALVHWVLDAPWSFDAAPLLVGLAATVALALAVGFLVTFRLLGQKPLPVLRRE